MIRDSALSGVGVGVKKKGLGILEETKSAKAREY